ncbi:MAG: DegV family protein [Acidimicrobiales bacterium]|jgi:DegV family protein with EDD domain
MPEEIPAGDRPQGVGEGGIRSTSGKPKPRIRVVTDSAADLDRAVAADHGVGVVHLDVRLGAFGPEVTSTWSPEEFWERSAAVAELPETSAPSPGEFKETFSGLADEGAEGIVCITLSSKLSATYQAAVIGAESVTDRIRVRVVDSLLATMAEGLTVLDAVVAAEAGGDLEAVERAAIASRERILLFGALESLDNLRKGGRLGSAQALLGGLLDIKPVLEIRDGVLELESRPRTRSRSFERLATKVREAGELDRIAVVHAAASDVDSFVGLLATLLPRDRISVGWLGPVVGTHVGRGTVAVAAQRRVR